MTHTGRWTWSKEFVLFGTGDLGACIGVVDLDPWSAWDGVGWFSDPSSVEENGRLDLPP